MKLRLAFKILARAHRGRTRQGTINRAMARWERWHHRLMKIAKTKGQRTFAARAYRHVLRFFNGDSMKADLWFWLDNPMLGGVSPQLLIAIGRGHKLLQFVEEAMAANAAAEAHHIANRLTKRAA